MKQITVALLLALVAVPVALSATAIVTFRTDQRIVLASDSVAVGYQGDGGHFLMTTCKIRPAGRWWFLVGGFQGGRDARGGETDVFAAITRALEPTTSMRSAMAALRQLGRTEITDRAVTEGSQLGKGINKLVEGAPLLHVSVAGLDRGVLTIGLFGMLVQRTSPLAFRDYTGVCPGDAQCAADGRVLLGSTVAKGPLTDLLNAPPPWVARADAAGARRLIQMQIAAQTAATRGLVGPPIDVLQIDGNGRATWIGRDPASTCAPIVK